MKPSTARTLRRLEQVRRERELRLIDAKLQSADAETSAAFASLVDDLAASAEPISQSNICRALDRMAQESVP